MPGKVFISYGHVDVQQTPWVERLRPYLMQTRHANGVEIWDDSQIQAGTNWRQSIASALKSADAAILLVGPGFLSSKFVRTEELPFLLKATEQTNLPLFPLVVAQCNNTENYLQSIQAFNNAKEPLESLPHAEQNRIMNTLAIAINKRIEN